MESQKNKNYKMVRFPMELAERLKGLNKGSYAKAISYLLNQNANPEGSKSEKESQIIDVCNSLIKQLEIVNEFLSSYSNGLFNGLILPSPIGNGFGEGELQGYGEETDNRNI